MNKCVNIAVIDDEESIHIIFKAKFRKEIKEGLIKLFHFHNGKECYDFIEENSDNLEIILLLSDINMPVMDGFGLLEHVKSKYPHISVVMCSAYDTDEYKQKTLSLGADDFLTKPVDFNIVKDLFYKKLD